MILEFNVYQKRFKKDTIGRHRTQHIFEDDVKIVLMFNSFENVKYYTKILKYDIIEFSEMMDIAEDKAIEDFKTNYAYHAVPFEGVDKPELQEQLQEESEPLDTDIYIETMHKELLEAGDDIVDEAEDYSNFLLKTFDGMEKKVLNAVNKIGIQKSFGDFLSAMFNAVNTKFFAGQVKKFIKQDMVVGLESAEKELNVDIGFTQPFQDKLEE